MTRTTLGSYISNEQKIRNEEMKAKFLRKQIRVEKKSRAALKVSR